MRAIQIFSVVAVTLFSFSAWSDMQCGMQFAVMYSQASGECFEALDLCEIHQFKAFGFQELMGAQSCQDYYELVDHRYELQDQSEGAMPDHEPLRPVFQYQ